MSGTFDPIALGILWDRLISITDEIVETLVRTSFSTNVRESYDLSCVIFDARGRALAQGSYSVPSFTGTAPLTIRHMLDRFPADTLEPGDVLATGTNHRGLSGFQDGDLVELETEGLGRLRIHVKDELKRTWARETRLERQEKKLEGTTPQLTGKHAPAR